MPLPRHQDLLADSVLASSALLSRYLVGFNDQNRTTQAPGLPNHAAWCLGHLSLTMHRACDYGCRTCGVMIPIQYDTCTPLPFHPFFRDFTFTTFAELMRTVHWSTAGALKLND